MWQLAFGECEKYIKSLKFKIDNNFKLLMTNDSTVNIEGHKINA